MKGLLFVLVILLMLTGCQLINNTDIGSPSIDEITTYEETIEDGKVIIDGISYDIQSVRKTTYTYDDNENIIELVTTDNDSETRIEYLYENNHLIEGRRYLNDELSSTNYYYYEDDLLIKEKSVHKGGLETRTEYSYGNKTETRTHYNSDGSLAFSSTAYLDDDDKILKTVNTTAKGDIMASGTFHYEDDLLTKVIEERYGDKFRIFNYEYNNIGDKIMEYNITFMGKDNLLVAMFYDYEYNGDLLPKTITTYRVQSPILEENIRDY